MQLENCKFSDGGKKYKGIYSAVGLFGYFLDSRQKVTWCGSIATVFVFTKKLFD
jgi:hypothetical protein